MRATVPPFPCTGLWPPGTLLETADGPQGNRIKLHLIIGGQLITSREKA